jgi:hypothetical protein
VEEGAEAGVAAAARLATAERCDVNRVT